MNNREKHILEKYTGKGKAQARLKIRAEMILLAAEGNGNNEIGKKLGRNNATVRKWRNRWADSYIELQKFVRGNSNAGISDSELERKLLEILTDAPRPGTPPVITKGTVRK